jgi:N-acetylmuramoyl-L-alanine amidase
MLRNSTAYWRILILGICLISGIAPMVVAATGQPQSSALASNLPSGLRFSISGNETEITFPIARSDSFQAVIETAPNRLIVDLPIGAVLPGAFSGKGRGSIRDVRIEHGPGGGNRIVFALANPAVIARVLTAVQGNGARAVIDLATTDPIALQAMAGVVYRPQPSIAALTLEPPGPHVLTLNRDAPPQPDTVAPPAVTARSIAAPAATAKVAVTHPAPNIAAIISPKRTIVIDAGHGGIDPGAESVAGYHEKEVTLATARMLRQVLERTGRYIVVMTRDSDVYLKLHERVAVARAAHGSLFVSLHADSIAGGIQAASDRITRGASIYTLSENASDAASERYAQRENRADAIGGVDLGDQSDDVASILVDLTVRETVNEGNRFAGMLVDSLDREGVTLLPRAPHRSAGFAVLKSPDIPSVLIEMGYLSDIADARGLADPRHQLQIAKAVADGIDRYFAWLETSRS